MSLTSRSGAGGNEPFSPIGGGRVSGAVNRAGVVAVNVSVGASKASGGGRLVGTGGAGAWRGIISGGATNGPPDYLTGRFTSNN